MHGIAAKLLEEAERALMTAGCTRVTLNTTEPLARARGFYERHGFVRSGAVGDFYGMALDGHVKRLA